MLLSTVRRRRFIGIYLVAGTTSGSQTRGCSNYLHHSHRYFSTTEGRNVASSKGKPLSLRRLAQPFLLAYHPDRIASSTDVVRKVNLEAVQTLNGFIDVVESIYDRAADPASSTQIHGRTDIQSIYSIEFVLAGNNNSDTMARGGSLRMKKAEEKITSRRCVEISFSERERASVQIVDGNGRYSVFAATSLRNKARKEIVKLLHVAGLILPQGANVAEECKRDADAMEQYFLNDELDLDSRATEATVAGRFERRREKTPYEKSRDDFMKRMDWKKLRQMYNEAVEDMKRDVITEGLVQKSEYRKEMLISHVLSRVSVYQATTDATAVNIDVHIHSDTIDPIQQLIALRRLSLLMSDNFDHLEMEEMGRMWETLFLVLTPPRIPPKLQHQNSGNSSTSKRENGFKFTLHSDKSVTVYLPIDFTDDEFLISMKRNLSDFYDICVIDDGLNEFFPQYYREWVTEARNFR